MNLPFFKNNPLLKKKEEKEFFLALLVKPFHLGAIIFEEVNKNLLILSSKEETEEKHVQEFKTEELVASFDKVISTAEESLPEGAGLEKTIFALPYDWVEEGHIKKDYLLKFKKVCEELALKPIGFIVSIEAIIAYLQTKQGAPITSLFIEHTKESVSLYLVRAGNIVEVKHASIIQKEEATVEKKDDTKKSHHDNAVKVVETLLKEVTSFDTLPSKIVLLNQKESEESQHAFISHRWTQHLPFLHEPKVVVLEKGFENEAIIHGVAGQMGFEVLEDAKKAVIKPEPEVSSKAEKKEEISAVLPISNGEEMGFFKNKDIGEEQKVIEDKPVNIQQEVLPEEKKEKDESYPENTVSLKDRTLAALSPLLSGGFLKKVPISTIKNSIHMPKKLPGRGLILFPVLALVLIGVFIFVYYNFLLSANVSVFLDQKSFDSSSQISLSVDSETSASDSTLHMNKISKEISGSESHAATGKKDTGEKAKGELTIYNKTENKKTFDKGTIIEGVNNLEFVLAGDATVASTSAFSTSLSSVKVKVEAAKFGQEYNLPSATNFSFKEFATSSFFAKNDSAFSGGTKKSVTVVSKKDLDELTVDVTDSLKAKAMSQVTSDIGSEDVIIPTPLEFDFSTKKFDKKEGDEASKVTLNAEMSFAFGTYKKSDIENLVKDMAKEEVPGAYSLARDKSNIELTDITINKDNSVSGELKIKANYLPTLNASEIEKQITGKTESAAESIIQDTEGISDVTVVFHNKLPFLPSFLPMNTSRIHVEVKS